jgi:hypothetical protein
MNNKIFTVIKKEHESSRIGIVIHKDDKIFLYRDVNILFSHTTWGEPIEITAEELIAEGWVPNT